MRDVALVYQILRKKVMYFLGAGQGHLVLRNRFTYVKGIS